MSKSMNGVYVHIVELIDSITEPMERKIGRLQKDIDRCHHLMTKKQISCAVRGKQGCDICDEVMCCENTSEESAKSPRQVIYGVIEESLTKGDAGLIDIVISWLLNTKNDVLMDHLCKVTNTHRVLTWLVRSVENISLSYQKQSLSKDDKVLQNLEEELEAVAKAMDDTINTDGMRLIPGDRIRDLCKRFLCEQSK